MTIGVFIVEDDPIAAEAHAAYVARVPGFTVVGHASTGQETLQALQRIPRRTVDLVLLDMGLPDMHGLDVCRALRAAGYSPSRRCGTSWNGTRPTVPNSPMAACSPGSTRSTGCSARCGPPIPPASPRE